ncbi:MAG TPA: glycosyltransferase [Verrucomicrobiae bacterium]|jgi:glycosyltransferase involved in cell wall biosynthesis|nr:glycosyltransferase [Verrucomicrobiae bacterium]
MSCPKISVMVPAYRPNEAYLRETLESVLQQDAVEEMQIEVVDDCSPEVDVAGMVRAIAGDRVGISRTAKNSGLAGCWNECIARARGEWVHILHQDDFVLPEFYGTLTEAAQVHPEVNLLATRSFYVTPEGVIQDVTPRVKNLEQGSRVVDDFFYATPIQCPGIMVKASFYKSHGGFRTDLPYTLDSEMWTRVIGTAGGFLSSKVLSCYRISGENQTARLARTADNLHDLERLHQIFARLYPTFDPDRGRKHISSMALREAERFASIGLPDVAKAQLDYWKRNAPLSHRVSHGIRGLARRFSK